MDRQKRDSWAISGVMRIAEVKGLRKLLVFFYTKGNPEAGSSLISSTLSSIRFCPLLLCSSPLPFSCYPLLCSSPVILSSALLFPPPPAFFACSLALLFSSSLLPPSRNFSISLPLIIEMQYQDQSRSRETEQYIYQLSHIRPLLLPHYLFTTLPFFREAFQLVTLL